MSGKFTNQVNLRFCAALNVDPFSCWLASERSLPAVALSSSGWRRPCWRRSRRLRWRPHPSRRSNRRASERCWSTGRSLRSSVQVKGSLGATRGHAVQPASHPGSVKCAGNRVTQCNSGSRSATGRSSHSAKCAGNGVTQLSFSLDLFECCLIPNRWPFRTASRRSPPCIRSPFPRHRRRPDGSGGRRRRHRVRPPVVPRRQWDVDRPSVVDLVRRRAAVVAGAIERRPADTWQPAAGAQQPAVVSRRQRRAVAGGRRCRQDDARQLLTGERPYGARSTLGPATGAQAGRRDLFSYLISTLQTVVIIPGWK